MSAQHKLGDELGIYHPRLQIDNLPIVICMRMYIFWKIYQNVNRLSVMLAFLDSLMIVYSSSHCHAMFVTLKTIRLYLNRGYKWSKYQLHYFKCESTFRVERFKGFFEFFFSQ